MTYVWPAALFALLLTSTAGLSDSAETANRNLAAPAVTMLDQVELPAEVNGIKLKELSGLAWDEDEKVLYAVSDKGVLFHLDLQIRDSRIVKLEPTASFRFKDQSGSELSKEVANAEGVSALNAGNGIRGDTELLVVFETGPAIMRFTPTGGMVAEETVPAAVAGLEPHGDERNGLESVARHGEYGLLTAPTKPINGEPVNLHSVYSSSGRKFSFEFRAPGKSRLKAIEILPDGRLLMLERNLLADPPSYVTVPRLLDPGHCKDGSVCHAEHYPDAELHLPRGNFEGLARVAANTFIAVSDDRIDGNRRALFILFDIK